VNNFGASGNITSPFTKLVHVVCREAGIKMLVQFFWDLYPQNLRAH